MIMDQTNRDILKSLRDGRAAYSRIAHDLGITENTVRTRVQKMIEEGILEISGLVDPERVPGLTPVIIGVKLGTMDLVKKGEEFSRLRGVLSASVVTGRYDLILTVLLSEGFGLLEFYTDEVAGIKDVQSVETFVIYKNYNMKVPYIC